MNSIQPSLVACATKEASFAEQIAKAANFIGKDFIATDGLPSVLEQCHDRISTCIVVDYSTAFDPTASFHARKKLRAMNVLVAVPPGNLQAAFQAGIAGATGVFECDVPHKEVAACLTAAFTSDSAARETEKFSHCIYSELNKREKQILFYLMDGQPNKCVASIMDIGLRTVESGRAELMKKLGVNSLVGLVALVTEVEYENCLSRRRLYEIVLDGKESNIQT